MPVVDLSEQEWQAVIAAMGYAPAREVIPLMNKIGAQIARQVVQRGADGAPPPHDETNSGKEARHGE